MPVRRPQSHFILFVFGCLVTSALAILPAGLAVAAPSSSSASVSISKLPGSFIAGGKAGLFESSARVSGSAKIYRQYVIRLTGLVAAGVKAEKQAADNSWTTLSTIAGPAGMVTVREEVAAGQLSKIRLTFGAMAPAGRATITLEAYDQRDQKLLGRSSAYQTTIMKGSGASGSATADAPAASTSAEPVVAVPSPAAAQQLPDLPVAGTSGRLLGLGALMVFGGLAGVIVLALVSGRKPVQEAAPKEEPTG